MDPGVALFAKNGALDAVIIASIAAAYRTTIPSRQGAPAMGPVSLAIKAGDFGSSSSGVTTSVRRGDSFSIPLALAAEHRARYAHENAIYRARPAGLRQRPADSRVPVIRN